MSKSIKIKFGDDRKSQAGVTHLFDALLGRKPTPTCSVCGVITKEKGPLAGRCVCNKEKP